MLTIQQIKEYGKISGNTVTEHFPMSSVKRYAISLLEDGIELYPEDWNTNDKYMIGISFKVKTYWFSRSIFESSELKNCELFFDHSYNGNTGQVIKGFNQGYDVEERILNKLKKSSREICC